MADRLHLPVHPDRRRRFAPARALLLAGLGLLASQLPASASDPPETRVGIPIILEDIYVAGGELRPKPRPNRDAPLVVRLLEVKPAQDGRRYDFEVYGLEPGSYDLSDFLEPLDPADPPRVTRIPLVITTALPPGLPRPAELEAQPPSRVGGYQLALWAFGTAWVAGLLVIILWKRRSSAPETSSSAPPSLAERLRELLTKASHGELEDRQKATLERLILGYWRQRLPALDRLTPAEALVSLRDHPEAGPLLRKLEQWLHAPQADASAEQIEALLAVYRES